MMNNITLASTRTRMNLNDPGCMGLREVRHEKCGGKLAGEPGVNHVFFDDLIGQAV
jgi:hypothetical protein